jgi:hypothetical protein
MFLSPGSRRSGRSVTRKRAKRVGAYQTLTNYEQPDDASIALAIEANDAFIDRLEAIRAAADGTIDED